MFEPDHVSVGSVQSGVAVSLGLGSCCRRAMTHRTCFSL